MFDEISLSDERFMQRERNPNPIWWGVSYENSTSFLNVMREFKLSVEELLGKVLELVGSPDETLNLRYRFLPQLRHLVMGNDLEFAEYIQDYDWDGRYPFQEEADNPFTKQRDVTVESFFDELLPEVVASLRHKKQ